MRWSQPVPGTRPWYRASLSAARRKISSRSTDGSRSCACLLNIGRSRRPSGAVRLAPDRDSTSAQIGLTVRHRGSRCSLCRFDPLLAVVRMPGPPHQAVHAAASLEQLLHLVQIRLRSACSRASLAPRAPSLSGEGQAWQAFDRAPPLVQRREQLQKARRHWRARRSSYICPAAGAAAPRRDRSPPRPGTRSARSLEGCESAASRFEPASDRSRCRDGGDERLSADRPRARAASSSRSASGPGRAIRRAPGSASPQDPQDRILGAIPAIPPAPARPRRRMGVSALTFRARARSGEHRLDELRLAQEQIPGGLRSLDQRVDPSQFQRRNTAHGRAYSPWPSSVPARRDSRKNHWNTWKPITR